jgi:hypothetical protein
MIYSTVMHAYFFVKLNFDQYFLEKPDFYGFCTFKFKLRKVKCVLEKYNFRTLRERLLTSNMSMEDTYNHNLPCWIFIFVNNVLIQHFNGLLKVFGVLMYFPSIVMTILQCRFHHHDSVGVLSYLRSLSSQVIGVKITHGFES